MTSFGHQAASLQGWNPSFKIQGQVINHYIYFHDDHDHVNLQVFHRIGSLLPPAEAQPKFLQVYFLDSFAERGLSQDILKNLTEWFHHHNHYVRELKTAKDMIEEGNIEERKIVIREDRRPQSDHERRYNSQKAAEVAITQQQYYCFHMMVRDNNYLLQGASLFQQYLVDAYCKIQTESLQFSRPSGRTTTRAFETASWQQMKIPAKSARGWCSQLHIQVGRGTCMRNSAITWPKSDAWGGLTYS